MESLYHYCNSNSFVSIVSAKSIWLSSLSLSNDTMEGRLVKDAILRLAERDELGIGTRERLGERIGVLESSFDGLGFCLSEEADLLSQWRGYADDGRGVSIGFSRVGLEALAISSKEQDVPGFSLYKVEYEAKEHESKVAPTYQALRNLINDGALKPPGLRGLLDTRTKEEVEEEDKLTAAKSKKFFYRLLELFPHLFELKSSAFREEKEWRLVSILIQGEPDRCLYRSSLNRVIPYRSFALPQGEQSIITEVVLGPRHDTPVNVVKTFLETSGFKDVSVRRSDATYR